MSRAVIIISAILLVAGGAAAQCGTGIAGAITDAETGQRINGAVVTAAGPNGSGTGTQGCCGYKIQGLEPGMYWVTAAAEGYLPGEYPDSVEVVENQTTGGIDIALEPDGGGGGSSSLSGAVTDFSSGAIIRHATVTAAGEAGSFEVGQGCRGYRFCELEPGTYWVSAEAEGYLPGNYPDSVVVPEGQAVEDIDFALEPDSGSGGGTGSISGAVTDESNGGIIRHATVTATSETGSYEVGQGCHGYRFCELEPGTYWVTAEAENYFPGHYPDSVVVEEGQAVEDIDFELQPDDAIQLGVEDGLTDILARTLAVAPNPADGNTTVRFEQEKDTEADVRLMDITGRTVWSTRTSSRRNAVRVETANLANGTYLVIVRDARGTAYRKLIVEH